MRRWRVNAAEMKNLIPHDSDQGKRKTLYGKEGGVCAFRVKWASLREGFRELEQQQLGPWPRKEPVLW
jgi:hypothetical protein